MQWCTDPAMFQNHVLAPHTWFKCLIIPFLCFLRLNIALNPIEVFIKLGLPYGWKRLTILRLFRTWVCVEPFHRFSNYFPGIFRCPRFYRHVHGFATPPFKCTYCWLRMCVILFQNSPIPRLWENGGRRIGRGTITSMYRVLCGPRLNLIDRTKYEWGSFWKFIKYIFNYKNEIFLLP